MSSLPTNANDMDHKSHQGAILLITIIVITIIGVVLLTTQLLLIQQSYESTYGIQRNEQSVYNSLGNLALVMRDRLKDITPTPQPYNSSTNSHTNNDWSGNTFRSQTTSVDSSRRTELSFSPGTAGNGSYADMILILDRSASMASGDFTTAQYSSCLMGVVPPPPAPNPCGCLIPMATPTAPVGGYPAAVTPAPSSSCNPISNLSEGVRTAFNATTFNDATTRLWRHVRIGSIIYGANSGSPSTYIAEPSSGSTVTPSDYAQLNTQAYVISNHLTFPSGYSDISQAVTQAATRFYNATPPSHIPAGVTFYRYIILMTDGNPTAYNNGSTRCEDSSSPTFANCLNQATLAAQNAINTASANGFCFLILGYGSSASPDPTPPASLTGLIAGVTTTAFQNGNCDPDLSESRYVTMVPNISSVGTELAKLVQAVGGTLAPSLLIQETTPQN